MLVVCPTNSLANNVTKDDGFDAFTLYTIVGRRTKSTEKATLMPKDVAPYEVILFEEVYFYTVQQLEWQAAWRRRGKHTFVFVAAKMESHICISNGDPAQNKPVVKELLRILRRNHGLPPIA